MWSSALCTVTVAWMLTGCACGRAPIEARAHLPTPPPSLTADCGALAEPTGPTLGDLLRDHVAVARQYHECRARHRRLAEWARALAASDGLP